jgi:hypothetical protein
MSALLGQRVFAVGDVDYRWEDVVLGALLRGDWGELVDEVRWGLACADHAARTGRTHAPDDDAAAAEFRYARGLVSADDTRRWLGQWSVTPCAWMAHVRRALLRERLAGELAGTGAVAEVSDAAVAQAILCEGACSGQLLRLARRLAARVAVTPPDAPDAGDVDGLVEALHRALATQPLPPLDVARCAARAPLVARAELGLRQFSRAVVTERAVDAQIAAHRLEWTRLDYRALGFPDASEAAEAALCARVDGDSLRQVAADAGRPLLDARAFLGETDDAVRDRLLGAAEREVIGPLECGGEFVLIEILGRCAPSVDEPEVARRAARLVLARALRRAMDERVRWDYWP